MDSFGYTGEIVGRRNQRRLVRDIKRNSNVIIPKDRVQDSDLLYCVRETIDEYLDYLYSNGKFGRLFVSMTEDLGHPIYNNTTLKWMNQIMNYDPQLTELYIHEGGKGFSENPPDTLLLEYKPLLNS